MQRAWLNLGLSALVLGGLLVAVLSFGATHGAMRGVFGLGSDELSFPASWAEASDRLAVASLSLGAMGPGLFLSWYGLRAWAKTQEEEQGDGAPT